ncbi:YbjN domain-containing protein [Ferrimonas gelatinilytica]|uniref:YbjN domain-containing protein n=1 Tax=Ferrimonas gelatinilytica TaxID=1255257 RepID=A0ABP9RVU1_9GAMM
MPNLPVPNHDTLRSWLEQSQIEYFLCGSCEGLHLPQLQEINGIYDAKIEIEGEFVYLSASIEIRPTGLMTAFAKMSELNSQYPTLKIFVEMVDDTLPRILLCHNLALTPGISPDQFHFFVSDCIEQMSQAAKEIEALNVVFYGEEEEPEQPSPPVQSAVIMH